jgi:chromosome segregation ATPase
MGVTAEMTMIDQACLAAWPDYETVTDEMRSRMRAAIAAIEKAPIEIIDLSAKEIDLVDRLNNEIATLEAERDNWKTATGYLTVEMDRLREQLQKVTEERNELQAALRNRAG